jgi:NTP pyrophosphatase (non-canonical NTP hydrolase)
MFNELAEIVVIGAREKGFWSTAPQQQDSGKLMLMVSELSEAMEELRSGHDRNEVYYSETGKPEGVPIELADCLIRILDYCGQWGIDIDMAVAEKMAYNKTRPYKHGNKQF